MSLENGGSLSASDVALLSGRNNDDFGFGGNGGMWMAFLFLIAIMNGGSWGNNGYDASGILGSYAINSDSATLSRQIDSAAATLERKGDSINEQLCMMGENIARQFNDVNTTFLTQNGIMSTNMANNFANVNQGISNNRYETQLAVAGLGAQMQHNFCDTRVQAQSNTNAVQSDIANVNYNLMANTNGITNAVNQGFCNANQLAVMNTRDIIDNNNANYRALHDEIIADRLEEKNEKIAELQNRLANANLAASQAAQNNYLIDKLQPTPVPSFPSSQLYGYYGNCNCNGGM